MKLILQILFLLFINTAPAVDYIFEFQANIKMIKEYTLSETKKFKNYELIGTFTDDYGNYGKFDGVVSSDIEDNKLIKLEGTARITYSNNEKIYIKAYRKESDFDAGVANMKIIGASINLKSLINTNCIQSVRYFKDTIFGKTKCGISKRQADLLKGKFN